MSRKRKPSGRGKGYKSRQVRNRPLLQRFLIVCEGEKTEPVYFDGFRIPSVYIETLGLGKDPLELVEHAQSMRSKNRYDQVWCVFDKDDVLPDRFNQALALAKRHAIKVAYSNQAFELWYLLHFHYCDVALARRDYIDGLTHQLGRPYEKNDRILYQELLSKQDHALHNAERLLEQYSPTNPAVDDPSTTVFQLVQELNRFVKNKRFSKGNS